MNTVHLTQVEAGKVIAYRLLPRDLPRDRERIWRGKVEAVNLVERCAWVTTIDKGYEGLHECITFDQIVAIWKEDQE